MELGDEAKVEMQRDINAETASASGCSLISNDHLLLLTLEWLDTTDLIAFDTAAQSNGCMKPTWLRVVRIHADIRPMRDLLYSPY